MAAERILFVMPVYGGVDPNAMLAAMRMCSERPDITFSVLQGSPIDVVRNKIVSGFLEAPEYTHLLMMDSDIVPPDGIVQMLLDCDAPMAAAPCLMFLDGMIMSNVVMLKDDGGTAWLTHWNAESVPFEAHAAGTGCVLCRREVFEKLEWPWFRFTDARDGSRIGEDIYFADKAAKVGLRYVVHPKATCDHRKNVSLQAIVNGFKRQAQSLKEEVGNVKR